MLIDFVGLSYEVQQLSDPSLFSGKNSGLTREFKELSSTGVLRDKKQHQRIRFRNLRLILPNQHPQVREVAGEPKAQDYAMRPGTVRNLAAFLQATGWTGVYGIGMGTNTTARTAEEAAFAAETLGGRLQYI